MDENNNQELQVPIEPTKKEKAEKAGKDVAEVGAKAAANYFAGPMGGAIVDKVAQTKLGQNILNTAGKNLAKNPIARNTLAKAQPAIQKAKPALNQIAGSLGGNPNSVVDANAADIATKAGNTTNNSVGSSNLLTSKSTNTNNSGFGNNKSGLFSNGSTDVGGSVNDISAKVKKAQKIWKIIGIIAPIAGPVLLGALVVLIIVSVIMTQIMAIVEFMGEVSTGIDKFVNFVQGDGWMTDEEYVFSYLKEEYEEFKKTVDSGELDVPLVAATIHYATVVDPSVYGEEEATNDGTFTDDSFDIWGVFLAQEQTASFYAIAKERMGKVNTLWPGQKRLLGHIVKTEITIDSLSWEASQREWSEFYNLVGQSIDATFNDALEESGLSNVNAITSIAGFIESYKIISQYVEKYGNAFAGLEYDVSNMIYEAQEFLHTFEVAYEKLTNSDYDDSSTYIAADEEGLFLSPVVTRTTNYGYVEYKQMKQDLLKIKSILSSNNESFNSDSDALNKAKNSSNTELKELYNSYHKNELAYEYSYTHYLQKVYIPATYFYKKSHTQDDIDKIVEEIFDQKDFYNYVTGNTETSTQGLQLGADGYAVRVEAPTSNNKYFTPPLNGSTLGQCAWYAKGRAMEIVDNLITSEEKRELAMSTIKSIYANGNQWYHENLLEIFAHSTDYKQPKTGSIVVYDWVNPDSKGNRYGHVAIVEKVENGIVYVSHGWNSCGGAYGEATWDCVGFGYKALTVEEMQNLGRPSKYKFVGYVYLLD